MNEERRKKLRESITAIDNCRGPVEEVRDQEQEAFDNLSENLQGGEKGEAMEGAIQAMEECLDALEQAVSCLENIL